MKREILVSFTSIVLFLFSVSSTVLCEAYSDPQVALKLRYTMTCQEPSDINEHLPLLKALAMECASVVEIGMRTMLSSWGLLQGLSENPSPYRSYLGIDINLPPPDTFNTAKRLANDNGISFRFWQANDMNVEIVPTELLFIDSLHTYCHLSYELEKFSPKVSKYIAMHDTSEPWGDFDDTDYTGNYSEYPRKYSRMKSGLWPAVEDFLQHHPEWALAERHLNNHGFTILKRVAPS